MGDISYNTRIVAIGNGEVWYDTVPGILAECAAANGAVSSNTLISMTPAFSKVYIVDGTGKFVLDFTNTKLTVSGMSTPPARGATITQATSGATMTVDYIDSAKTSVYGFNTSGTFDGTHNITATGMTGTVTVSAVAEPVTAGAATPHWYAWGTYAGLETMGTMPEFSTLVATYRGRLVLNSIKYPNIWYMSRQANPYDWLYGSNDQQSAVAGTDNVLGFIGDIPTCFIPFENDYMIVGCAHQIEMFRGDPCTGGSLDKIYTSDGIFGPKSYCFDGYGNLYFAGTGGIYRIEVGTTSPVPLTNTRIPKLLDGVDRDTHRITMGYDRQKHGIVISILNIALNTSVNYWYDIRTKGIFPETYNVGVSSQEFYDANSSTYNQLAIGCSDGYLRYFKQDSYSDQSDGDINQAIDSEVVYGPLMIADGNSTKESILNSTAICLGTGTTNANYDIYVNKSAEELIDDLGNSGITRGTLVAGGRQNDVRSRARGKVMAIKIGNSTAEKTFAIERIDIDVLQNP